MVFLLVGPGSAEFEDLLISIEASSFLPLLHMATFPVSSRVDS